MHQDPYTNLSPSKLRWIDSFYMLEPSARGSVHTAVTQTHHIHVADSTIPAPQIPLQNLYKQVRILSLFPYKK